jgi:ABC-2 type transport system permease protein
MGWFFTFVIPVLLVVNVPARIMAKNLLDPWSIAFMLAAAAGLLVASRRFFRRAMRLYRSASS